MHVPSNANHSPVIAAVIPLILLLLPLAGLAQVPITYQGQLTDSGAAHSGAVDMEFAFYNVAAGGSAQLVVPKPGVPVQEGLFQVELDTASLDFSQTWYLEARVEGTPLSPRQRVTAAPIALYALNSAGGGGYENVIVVAKSGGDFTSVAAALDSIDDSSETNRYLVWVGPGEYTETSLVDVPEYVHLNGAGTNAALITSSRGAAAPNASASTVALRDYSRLSNLSIGNTGAGPLGIAVYSAGSTRDTVIDNLIAHASGSGSGGGRYGLYLNDAAPTVRNSQFKGSGATGFGTAVNAGLGSVNIAAGFPQALILDSVLLGGAGSTVENCNDNSGTGFGMQLSESTPDIRNSHICGGHRGIALYQNGHPRIQHSEIRVSSTGNAFLFEITASGSISVAHSALGYLGNKLTGPGTGLRCVHNHDWGSWTALTDGVTAAAACN